ncbi:hypothetical protein DQ04_20481010 [Trypanosoma grayi]|uniref:hypothetical protein n=1 Tax=Trypanosoma grayi TaxID=71804 RepID=UPI0004F45745|nr:hypothetical protein DQ04_20481010 [Trypanosoma grayi]KEG05563.1 hypothetical protein DQ04_20481010 [Trypanosoma grayi]
MVETAVARQYSGFFSPASATPPVVGLTDAPCTTTLLLVLPSLAVLLTLLPVAAVLAMPRVGTASSAFVVSAAGRRLCDGVRLFGGDFTTRRPANAAPRPRFGGGGSGFFFASNATASLNMWMR